MSIVVIVGELRKLACVIEQAEYYPHEWRRHNQARGYNTEFLGPRPGMFNFAFPWQLNLVLSQCNARVLRSAVIRNEGG